MDARTKIVAGALVAAVAGAAAGWWGYSAHQKRQQRDAILALVTDTGSRLREALQAAEAPGDVTRLDEHAAAADRNFARLKEMDASREQALADDANEYVHTSREILKRLAGSRRYRQMLTDSLQALEQHLRADDRTGAWVGESVRANERVSRDLRDYGTAAGILEKLLQSLPASQKRIAPHTGPAALMDDAGIESARARALEGVKQATAEVEKVRRLAASR